MNNRETKCSLGCNSKKGNCEDRRITRSKRALANALIELMKEEGYDAITVNDLCERADLNRGTFYNHYKDKDDLLDTLEMDMLSDLDAYQARIARINLPIIVRSMILKKPLPVLVDLFDYLHEQGDFLYAVLGNGGDAGFANRLCDSVCTNLIHSILHEKYRNSEDVFVGYYVSFYASAYLGVIMRWIETGMKESSEEMAYIAMRLLLIKPGETIKL